MYKSENVKTKAVDMLIELVSANSGRLGVFMTRHRPILNDCYLHHIQKVSVTEYARLLLGRKSEYRAELVEIVKVS